MSELYASETRARLAAEGIDGFAAEIIVRQAGPARHEARTRRVLVELSLERDYDSMQAVALATLEGLLGRQLDVTERLTPFRSLGKGRRKASDGPMWDAAILSVRGSVNLKFEPDLTEVGKIRFVDQDGHGYSNLVLDEDDAGQVLNVALVPSGNLHTGFAKDLAAWAVWAAKLPIATVFRRMQEIGGEHRARKITRYRSVRDLYWRADSELLLWVVCALKGIAQSPEDLKILETTENQPARWTRSDEYLEGILRILQHQFLTEI